ncbi:MAG: DUF6443 domain-containing protein [Reichenbachiella sp.]|uniref:DUF6443 domain-containing protein n=1 Tax=Reichenbachiella sp. TaxID=2184521 RepID=UPI003298AA04
MKTIDKSLPTILKKSTRCLNVHGFRFTLVMFILLGISTSAFAQPAPGEGDDPPPAPVTSFTQTHACGVTTITRSSNPSAGVLWYWQSSSSGTSKGNQTSSYPATSTGTYYVRAYDPLNDLWSTSPSSAVHLSSANFIIKPATPSVPSVSNDCGGSVLTRGTPPTDVTWYWQSSSSGTSTGNPSSSVTRTTGTTYYLKARHDNSGCWSDAVSASYIVQTKPDVPNTASITSTYQVGSTTLTRTDPADPLEEWFWQLTPAGTQTDPLYKGQTYTVTSGNTIYLRSRYKLSLCWSEARAIGYQIQQSPAAPGQPTILTSCGEVRVQRGTPPSGETWYWQSSPSGQQLNASEEILTLTTTQEILNNGKHYLRSRNDTFGFWSTATEINYAIEDIPTEPAVSNVSVCTGDTETITITPLTGHDIKWYTIETGGTAFHTGNSYMVSASNTYYVSHYNLTTGCESTRDDLVVVTTPTSDGGVITGYTTGFGEVNGSLLVTGAAGDIMWQKKMGTQWIDSGSDGTGHGYTDTEDAEYRVRAINGDCAADYSNEVTNIVYPVPEIISKGGLVPDYNETVTLVTTPTGYDSYQWVKNGSDMAGETNSTLVTGDLGSYQVRVSLGGLSRTSTALTVTGTSVAQDYNHVRTYAVVDQGITQMSDLNAPNESKFRESSQYLDGLGRPVQSVVKKGSPGSFDIVQPVEYDALGRQAKNHLPYTLDPTSLGGNPVSDGSFKSGMFSDQDTYYDATYGSGAGDHAFSETAFDHSPLNRPLSTYAPGTAWAKDSGNRPVAFNYENNVSNEVILFQMAESAVQQSGYYGAGTLYKVTTQDENENLVQEFKNKQGQVLLKKVQVSESIPTGDNDWLHTYYVYDDLGNLRYVLPPAALKLINN